MEQHGHNVVVSRFHAENQDLMRPAENCLLEFTKTGTVLCQSLAHPCFLNASLGMEWGIVENILAGSEKPQNE